MTFFFARKEYLRNRSIFHVIKLVFSYLNPASWLHTCTSANLFWYFWQNSVTKPEFLCCFAYLLAQPFFEWYTLANGMFFQHTTQGFSFSFLPLIISLVNRQHIFELIFLLLHCKRLQDIEDLWSFPPLHLPDNLLISACNLHRRSLWTLETTFVILTYFR